MASITGIGAVIIYAHDPGTLADWYDRYLRIETVYNSEDKSYYGVIGKAERAIQFGIYPGRETLGNAGCNIMINFQVDKLIDLIEELTVKGVELEHELSLPYGKFAYITDPEGNHIELYEEIKKI